MCNMEPEFHRSKESNLISRDSQDELHVKQTAALGLKPSDVQVRRHRDDAGQTQGHDTHCVQACEQTTGAIIYLFYWLVAGRGCSPRGGFS